MTPSVKATARVRQRVLDLLDASRESPRGLRKTQSGIATALGLNKATISQILKGKSDFRMAHLDALADYFGVPPSTLFRLESSRLIELTPAEIRLVRHWRTWPAEIQALILPLYDYFAGTFPEEKEMRRWWLKVQRVRRPSDRDYIERTLDDVLRAQSTERGAGAGTAAPRPSAATTPANAVRRANRR